MLFIITGLVVLGNVVLRRLQDTGWERFAKRLDAYAIWIYPISYAIVTLGIAAVLM